MTNAALQNSELIQSSVQKVRIGNETGAALTESTGSAAKAAEVIVRIASFGYEQSAGHVNLVVPQTDDTTQRNIVLAEQDVLG